MSHLVSFLGSKRAGAFSFSDNFNRADTTAGLGPPWTAAYGTGGINNNRAYFPTLDQFKAGMSTLTRTSTGARHTVTLTNLTSGPGLHGFQYRYLNDQNYFQVVGNTQQLYYYQVINGSTVQAVQLGSGNIPEGSVVVLQDNDNGQAVFSVNGTVYLSVTESSLAGVRRMGIYTYAPGAATSAYFDDFSLIPI